MKSRLLVLVFILALAGAVALGACGESSDEVTSTPSVEATQTEEAEPVREGTDSSREGAVSREQAEQAALDAVGSGRVTWSGPEDDRGAAWEVEITRSDGSEIDVLIGADGTVVKQVEKSGGGPALSGPGTPPPGGVVSRQAAEQAALDHIGEGRVTWIGREDERGAAWEVEITRPGGSEIDVLVAPDGSIVQ